MDRAGPNQYPVPQSDPGQVAWRYVGQVNRAQLAASTQVERQAGSPLVTADDRAFPAVHGYGTADRQRHQSGATGEAWMNRSSPSWLMMTHLGSSRDGAAMLLGLELGRGVAVG